MTRTGPRAISLENHTKKKSRMRAVRLHPTCPEKAVRSHKESVRTRNFEFKMSDSYSEDYSESKKYLAWLNFTF